MDRVSLIAHLYSCLNALQMSQFRNIHLWEEKPENCQDDHGCMKAAPPTLYIWLDPEVVAKGGEELNKLIAHEMSHGILYPLADWALANASPKHKEYTTDLEEVVCDHLEEVLYKLLPAI